METANTTLKPYDTEARNKFDALKERYQQDILDVTFWKQGNAFDSIIDYFDIIDGSGAEAVAGMVVRQLDVVVKKSTHGYDDMWFDDFGWWSVATQRALKRAYFGAHHATFSKIHQECWSRFTSNAPFVWERRGTSTYDSYRPAVEGGVWNAYWDGTPDRWPGPKNGNPSDGHLIGIQNTVTNALYLMAARRYSYDDKSVIPIAQREQSFLDAWLKDPVTPLWWTLGTNAGLMRERVGHFYDGERAGGYQDAWAWTGDQGLTIGNYSDVMQLLPDGAPRGPAREKIAHLVEGVCERMTTSDNRLTSFTEGSAPDDDVTDYQTGPGVFWRNALYAWKNNKEELDYVFAGPRFQAVLGASARFAAQRPSTNLSFDDLVNDLAVLVAANAMQT